MGEAVANYLQAVGIRTHLRTMERAAFLTAMREKTIKGVMINITGAAGNAATRLEAYVAKSGIYSRGVVPEIEDLLQRQAREPDPRVRQALLHQAQKLVIDHALYAPIYQLAFIWGLGPRVEEPAADLIKMHAYSAPYEDVRLKK